MIEQDAIITYGEPIAYIDPKTGEGYFIGMAKGFVLGGSSREKGMALIVDSCTDEGLVEWRDARNLHSIARTKGLGINLSPAATADEFVKLLQRGKAEAWDEGWERSAEFSGHPAYRMNPYREGSK